MISMASLFAVAAVTVLTISPYFYDVTVDEAIPTAAAQLPSGTFIGSGDGVFRKGRRHGSPESGLQEGTE